MTSFPAFAGPSNIMGEVMDSFSGNSGSNITNAAQQIFTGVTQLAHQMQPQSPGTPDQIRAWQTLQVDARNNIGADASGMIRHFMFPNCLVPPDKTAKPSNLCEESAPDYMAQGLMTTGQDYINMYKKYVGGAQNSASPVGLQCLTNSVNDLKDSANTMLGELEKMLNAFDAIQKNFENSQQVNLKTMKELDAELNGIGKRASQDLKNKDYTKDFPKECNDLIKGGVNSLIKGNGFVGLQDNFINSDNTASRYRGASLKAKKQSFEDDLKKITEKLKNAGSDLSFIEGSTFFNGVEHSGILKAALTAELAPLKIDIQRTNAILSKLGISTQIPDIQSPTFQADLDKVVSQAQNEYKDTFILNCMKGTSGVAHSTTINNIIGEFEDLATGGRGNTLKNFKDDASSKLLNSQTISSLDANINIINNNNIRVSAKSSDNKMGKKTLSQYYADLKNECTLIYDGRLKPANGDTSADLYRNYTEQAKKEIAKIKEKVSSLKAPSNSGAKYGSIEMAAREIAESCNGKKPTSEMCTEDDVYSQDSGSFCFKKAEYCSNTLNACKLTAQKYVADKTAKLKATADLYNAAVASLEQQANGIVSNINTYAENMTKNLHAKLFPGGISPQVRAAYGISAQSGYQIPEAVKTINLPITDTELSGMLTKGIKNGQIDLKEMKAQMTKNVAAIKKAISQNVADQIARANEIIKGNETKWSEELEAWRGIIATCDQNIKTKAANMQKMAAEAAETAKQNNLERQALCTEIKLKCTGDGNVDDLVEKVSESAHLLNPDMIGFVQSCKQSTTNSDEEKPTKFEIYESYCEDAGSGTELLDSMKERVLAQIPDNLSESEAEEVKNYLDDPNAKLEDETKEKIYTSYINLLKGYRKLVKANTEENNNICKISAVDIDATCADKAKNTDGTVNDSRYKQCIKDEKENSKPENNSNVAKAASFLSLIEQEKTQKRSLLIGENYSGTSCASITGNGLPKSMMQNFGEDSIDGFSPNTNFR